MTKTKDQTRKAGARARGLRLSDVQVKTAKPLAKPYKLFDGGGLFLQVTPNGGKWWRLKYRHTDKEKLLSLGTYPAVSLADARRKVTEFRELLARGIDPSEDRKAAKVAKVAKEGNSFEKVTLEWFAKYSPTKAESHTSRVLNLFERDIFPKIGSRPIADLEPPDILKVVRQIETRGAVETAHRALTKIGQVFRYAVGTGRVTRDLTQDLKGTLEPAKHGHFSAPVNEAGVIDDTKVGELLRVLESYHGNMIVRCAVRLGPLVFVRPGELRTAKWSEIDLEKAEWSFLVTKTKTPHIVPLSRQAIEVLRAIHRLTGEGTYVFPNGRTATRPMSDGAVLAAYHSLSIPQETLCPHAWRAIARTMLHERLNFPPLAIEIQLAHKVMRGGLGSAYDRTMFLPERKEMMQRWADYLEELKGSLK